MLDDFFGPNSEFIKILNTYGLGLLGVGLVLLFRSLQARTDAMKELLATLKEKHESTIATLEKRAQVLDSIFADQKRFQDYYLKMTEDSIKHKDWIKQWKEEEMAELLKRLQNTQKELGSAQGRIEELEVRTKELEREVGTLRESLTKKEKLASLRLGA